MKMQKLAILLLAGLMFLPMTLMNASARTTVVNVNYTGQAWSAGHLTDEDLTLRIHGLGFPGEELEWTGKLVMPADHDTHPSSVSSIVMTWASYSSVGVSGSFALADSTTPDLNGCNYEFSANVIGFMYLNSEYQPYCPDIYIDAWWGATVVVNV